MTANTILNTSQKFHHYFETYRITVVTEYPLGDMLRNKEANGRITKRAVELGTYTIDLRSHQTIKSQVLAVVTVNTGFWSILEDDRWTHMQEEECSANNASGRLNACAVGYSGRR